MFDVDHFSIRIFSSTRGRSAARRWLGLSHGVTGAAMAASSGRFAAANGG